MLQKKQYFGNFVAERWAFHTSDIRHVATVMMNLQHAGISSLRQNHGEKWPICHNSLWNLLFSALNDKVVAGRIIIYHGHILFSASAHDLDSICHAVTVKARILFEKNISQGSAATRLRCGGIFNDANFSESALVIFLKSVNINRFFDILAALTFLIHSV